MHKYDKKNDLQNNSELLLYVLSTYIHAMQKKRMKSKIKRSKSSKIPYIRCVLPASDQATSIHSPQLTSVRDLANKIHVSLARPAPTHMAGMISILHVIHIVALI